MTTVARQGEGLGMITEQEYREAKARVQDYEYQQRAVAIEERKAAAKEHQRIIAAAVEDPSFHGVDISDQYKFRTPHKILYVPGPTASRHDSQLWFDMDDWYTFRRRVVELFPHDEEYVG